MRSNICGVLVILILLLAGCGGGGSGSSAAFTIQSGNWNFRATSTTLSGELTTFGGSLSQSGSSVSGTVQMLGGNGCIGFGIDIPVSGTVSGQNITLTTAAISNVVITINATGSATAFSGTYQFTGCVAHDLGNVTANLVPSVTGTWSGTFTSSTAPPLSVTAVLTESSTPDAHGGFPLTGTVSFTGSTCFTSGTVSAGAMTGATLGLVVATNEQPNPSQIIISGGLADPTVANNLGGGYILNLGACATKDGFGTLTRQ
ncbi:MAG TPA: hypothetical protein VFR08_13210 [Candidatus Angelobacter sp.]|nr:hypothetical protein [Candidatus Angelobacter sp.]